MRASRLALIAGLLAAAGAAWAAPAPAARRLRAAPATDGAACADRPTPEGFTCQQQAGWGKCGEAWMAEGGFCAATCGRCTSGNEGGDSGATAPAASPPANATAPAPPSSLDGKLAEYGKALSLSWRFYYAQRSGKLSGTANPVPWRGDSHLDDPVPGGFYDAGDHLKLNFPLATSLAFLAWGALDFPQAYAAADAMQAALDNLRWGADYLMACHKQPDTYIAQIGEPGADHSYWGRPEEQTGARPAYTWGPGKPASDAAGAAASALAATSLLLRPTDPSYAAACLDHARSLFALASQHEGKYSDSEPGATYVYASSSFLDDLALAAGWLYRATGEDAYLSAARGYLQRAQYQRNYFVSWDSVYSAADALLLGLGVGPSPGVDLEWQAAAFRDTWLKGQSGVSFSPRGLAIAPLGGWGNLRYSANAAFVALLHATHTSDASVRSACLSWAQRQLDYMLGLAGSERSFVVGYGNNPPTRPHHRAASCPNRPAPCTYDSAFNAPGPNPQVVAGALVGGPNSNDQYEDKRSDFQANEVAVDYNAGYTGALAGLIQMLSAGATTA